MPVTNLSSISFKLTLWYLASDMQWALPSICPLPWALSLMLLLVGREHWGDIAGGGASLPGSECYIIISLDPVHGPLLVCVWRRGGGDIGWYSSPAQAQLEQYVSWWLHSPDEGSETTVPEPSRPDATLWDPCSQKCPLLLRVHHQPWLTCAPGGSCLPTTPTNCAALKERASTTSFPRRSALLPCLAPFGSPSALRHRLDFSYSFIVILLS